MYILLFKDNTITSQQKKDYINAMGIALANKITDKELLNGMWKAFLSKKDFSLKALKSSHGNLLSPTEIYYHKNLRLIPKPKSFSVDYNSGCMVGHQEAYFLEMVASYTIEEVVNYFLSKDIVNTVEYTRNRLIGFFRHYIQKYGLEITLFIIEAIDHNIELRNCFNMNQFDDYYRNGKAYYENCLSNCMENGGDKVVPKKRVLFN